MSELIGQSIDRYKVAALLGEDRILRTYKAYDPKFDRTVTIYVIQDDQQPSSKILQNVRAISNWRSSGLSKLYDFGTFEGKDYIVQEFIPGPNLQTVEQELRQSDCWISLHEAVLLVKEICLVLKYVHHRGVIHGDLFPGMIQFRTEAANNLPYQPILIRTGLGAPSESLSPLAYRAPEAVRGGRIEKNSDIYSIGAILYELITSQPATPQRESSSGPAQVLPPHLLHPDLPDELEKIILKSLSPNPEDRFRDAGELAASLEQIEGLVTNKQSGPSGISRLCRLITFLDLDSPETERIEEKAAFLVPAAISAAPAIDISRDTVYVLLPDKSVLSFNMLPGGLTIGRSKENDITLDLAGISRNHARIDFDGQNYIVRDLNSLNGTFLDQNRLSPEKPLVWPPGGNLRIGEAWLRIERQSQTRTTQAVISRDLPTKPGKSLPETDEIFVGPNGESIEASQVFRSAGLGWIGAFTASLTLSVAPGASLEIPLLFFNRGPANDSIIITVQGIPLEWLPNPLQPVRVPSNGQREIRLIIRPPRSPLVKAGRYSLIIRAASQNSTNQVVEIRPTLTITAFSLFASELRPDQIKQGETGQVFIHNRGNLPETFTVVWEDRSHTLVFEPQQVKVNLQIGKSAVVEFRPSLAQPRILGQELSHPFKTYISSQGGQVENHPGDYLSRGIVPPWAPIALAILSILLACVLCLLVNQVTFPVRRAEQTAQAGRTELAHTTETAVFFRTATSQSLEGANMATIQAATATSVWMALDEDQDGLTNSLEIVAGTFPTVPDTDQDGLSDGVEVLTWKTQPVNTDTDGDGLNDGVEVQRQTNPLIKDTDGDGIDDAADPQPLMAATRTPIIYLPTATPPPQFTSTPTRTSTPTASATPRTVDLTISVSNGQGSSIPGTNTIYTILVTNKGPASVSNTAVVDQFPSTLLNITWTCSASPGSRCQTTNGVGNINALVDIPASGTVTLSASGSISPNATGLLSNVARVDTPAGLTELNPIDNQATDTDNLTPRAALSLSKTDQRDNINPGQATTYSIIVFNNGPSTVSGIRVQDSFPSQLNNITWTCSGTSGSSCSATGAQTGNINHLVNLNPGGSATFSVNATVRNDAVGTISNTASLESPIDPGTNNKVATDSTIVIPQADLDFEVISPISVTAGTTLTYTVFITNTGPSNATGVTLTNTLPTTSTFLSSNPGVPDCQENSGVVRCSLSNLNPGGALQVQIIINAPVLPGPFISVFEIRANENDPNPANNTESVSVTAN